jgi:pyruvate-formate lyase-activating enzyme
LINFKQVETISGVSNEHKSIAIGDTDENGNAKAMTTWSVEEALAARVNEWKNWLCAAGSENLHITADGNLFAATCRVGGFLGNVFEGKMSLPTQWITCTKQWCMCGADMQLRKAKSEESRSAAIGKLPPNVAVAIDTKQQLAQLGTWVAPAQYAAHQAFPKSITWDLSRRCNYSCSYCHPSVSNQFDAHHSARTLTEAIDRLNERFCKGIPSKWVITGGEPTANPAFMEAVDRINSHGHLIHVQSNGSRGPAYLRELINKACVGLSCHLEAEATDRFIETCRAIVEEKTKSTEAGRMWFGVRVMVGPGRLDEALQVREKLLEIPSFTEKAFINFSPLYQRLKQDQLMEYSKQELQAILKHA